MIWQGNDARNEYPVVSTACILIGQLIEVMSPIGCTDSVGSRHERMRFLLLIDLPLLTNTFSYKGAFGLLEQAGQTGQYSILLVFHSLLTTLTDLVTLRKHT